ncbi:aspartate/glutamate racemase family protein [Ideonella sp. A 288]|uniref:aspartate/glutamate racemase family protein n=1 Tax=Ideonella sp. A 288 TaxID=1962181 RepID=UPI000B4A5C47|nr:aspartate/glutamate racemase family protein [Ideonella sp. A 288]
MRLAILNPNTSAAVSARLLAHAQALLAGRGDVELTALTATLGASYIASEAGYAIAGHAALDAWARHVAAGGGADAVLLGCFGDPGVWALRETTGLPVVGLAEAAMRQAALHGRYAIVTGGAAWVPMLQRLAASLGLADGLAAVHAVAPSGAQLAADPAGAIALLRDVCVRAAHGVDAVILGGAGLAGYAQALAADLPVPLIDSASAGIEWLTGPPRPGLLAAPAGGAAPAWQGLAPALQQWLDRPG